MMPLEVVYHGLIFVGDITAIEQGTWHLHWNLKLSIISEMRYRISSELVTGVKFQYADAHS